MSAGIKLEDDIENSENHYIFTVVIYHEMIEKGILTTEHKIELLEGRLYEKYTGEFYKIPLEIYEAMVDEGILSENCNYEFVDGKIVKRI